jgi:hypothetical protein
MSELAANGTLCPVIQSVGEKLVELDRDRPPFWIPDDVRAELDTYFGRLKRAAADDDWLATRRNLVAIAAVCYRGCRDLEIIREADAVAKDDGTHPGESC